MSRCFSRGSHHSIQQTSAQGRVRVPLPQLLSQLSQDCLGGKPLENHWKTLGKPLENYGMAMVNLSCVRIVRYRETHVFWADPAIDVGAGVRPYIYYPTKKNT